MSKIKVSTLASRNKEGTYIEFSEIDDKILISIDDSRLISFEKNKVSFPPLILPEYKLSDLPDASDYKGCYVTVDSPTLGIVLCRSNGSTWNVMATEGSPVT